VEHSVVRQEYYTPIILLLCAPTELCTSLMITQYYNFLVIVLLVSLG
jgi:hypothetical protein